MRARVNDLCDRFNYMEVFRDLMIVSTKHVAALMTFFLA